MSGLEVNKIIAAIVMAVLIIFIISNIGDILVNTDSDKNAKTAFKIEESEANTDDTAKTIDNELTEIEPISALLASASIEKGEKIYKKCGACHTYKKDGASKMGPNLWNIINRTKANVDGFAYSKALSEFGGKWTYEEMSKFLYKPKDYIKGTKMAFAGLRKEKDRASVILYMNSKSSSPKALP